jgi:hypothetical protein
MGELRVFSTNTYLDLRMFPRLRILSDYLGSGSFYNLRVILFLKINQINEIDMLKRNSSNILEKKLLNTSVSVHEFLSFEENITK